MPEIPPWLNANPQRYGDLYAEGARMGQQAAIARAEIQQRQSQMAQQAQMAQVEMQAKQEALQKEHLLKQQEMEIAKSYKEQMLALQGQELQQKQQVQQQQLKQAAQRFSMQQLAQQRIAGGEDPSKVYQELGPIMGIPPAAYSAMNRRDGAAKMPTAWTGRDPTKTYISAGGALIPSETSRQKMPNTLNARISSLTKQLGDMPKFSQTPADIERSRILRAKLDSLVMANEEKGAAESPGGAEALRQEEGDALKLEGLPEGWSVITR